MFYAILFTHWFADFVCQTRQMANNKSSSNYWLFVHVLIYSLIMSVFGVKFGVVNGLAHFATDFCTSRGTSYFWKTRNTHAFFSVIGFDQFLHVAVLYWSMSHV